MWGPETTTKEPELTKTGAPLTTESAAVEAVPNELLTAEGEVEAVCTYPHALLSGRLIPFRTTTRTPTLRLEPIIRACHLP